MLQVWARLGASPEPRLPRAVGTRRLVHGRCPGASLRDCSPGLRRRGAARSRRTQNLQGTVAVACSRRVHGPAPRCPRSLAPRLRQPHPKRTAKSPLWTGDGSNLETWAQGKPDHPATAPAPPQLPARLSCGRCGPGPEQEAGPGRADGHPRATDRRAVLLGREREAALGEEDQSLKMLSKQAIGSLEKIKMSSLGTQCGSASTEDTPPPPVSHLLGLRMGAGGGCQCWAHRHPQPRGQHAGGWCGEARLAWPGSTHWHQAHCGLKRGPRSPSSRSRPGAGRVAQPGGPGPGGRSTGPPHPASPRRSWACTCADWELPLTALSTPEFGITCLPCVQEQPDLGVLGGVTRRLHGAHGEF